MWIWQFDHLINNNSIKNSNYNNVNNNNNVNVFNGDVLSKDYWLPVCSILNIRKKIPVKGS